jgi:hypothetical protein
VRFALLETWKAALDDALFGFGRLPGHFFVLAGLLDQGNVSHLVAENRRCARS